MSFIASRAVLHIHLNVWRCVVLTGIFCSKQKVSALPELHMYVTWVGCRWQCWLASSGNLAPWSRLCNLLARQKGAWLEQGVSSLSPYPFIRAKYLVLFQEVQCQSGHLKSFSALSDSSLYISYLFLLSPLPFDRMLIKWRPSCSRYQARSKAF